MSLENPNHEISAAKLSRDTRSAEERFFSTLFKPNVFKVFLIAYIALQLYLPGLWPFWILIIITLVMVFQDIKFKMPLRMPKDVGGLDRSDYFEELIEENAFLGLIKKTRVFRRFLKASGILYLGFKRSIDLDDQGRELWLTNSDARTHMFVVGTTGSGKSETLMSLAYNALCWGSGVCYGDGKADSNLSFCMWSLARRLGRDDDFLILNYLTGGSDPFKRMVEVEKGIAADEAYEFQSNSLNPFSDGAADFQLQLVASLIPKASGDGSQWQQKALNMIDALIRILCYKRAKGEIDISIGVIRESLALQNLVKFYIEGQDGSLPELAYLPIKSYFETALPGFDPNLASTPEKWDPEVRNQHGYLTGQFARTLAMMMDTYGFIFSDKYPEIDMLDVLLNNRILVVMIPSMEKSSSEAASLGKLYISCIRLMMAQNLGYILEGSKDEVLDAKATNSPYPSIIINDELAYYFAEGIAVMFAQARSLGFMMVAAAQDIQGLKRGEAGEEAASMIANTKVKWSLALEDAEDTFELIKKAGGQAYYSVLSGHDASVGTFTTNFQAQATASIQNKDKVTLEELKALNSGEGLVIFKDSVVPSASFYLPDDRKKTSKLSAKINRFLQIERPTKDRAFSYIVKEKIKKIGSNHESGSFINSLVMNGNSINYPLIDDPINDALKIASKKLTQLELANVQISAEDKGIYLFETVRNAIHCAENEQIAFPYYQIVTPEFPEINPEDLEIDPEDIEEINSEIADTVTDYYKGE